MRSRHLPGRAALAILALGFLAVPLASAQAPPPASVPLHIRIDRLIAAGTPNAVFAPLASDAELLRRGSLDLTGTIPTATAARAFLADADPAKRARLIDQLLASPECARHLQRVFDVWLMDRRPDTHVGRTEWQEFLRASFAANKPYDQLVRDILAADGSDPKARGPAKFFLDRNFEPNEITRDISRLFLGRNVQCAQCHDHPNVDDYKQADYYGVLAFLSRTFVYPAPGQKDAVLAEKAEGEVTFVDVFDKAKTQKQTGPHLPGGKALTDPTLEKGKEYTTAPAKGVKPVPAYSRRAQLAARLTAPENAAFRRTAANRFWALVMGRGLVHPLEWDHSGNPPSHPELLDLLADEFAAHRYDVKWFLRELLLSQTYQRASEMPSAPTGPDRYQTAVLKPLSPEQLAFAMMQATGYADAERQALGKNLTEDALHAKLAPQVQPFVATFGSLPGQPQPDAFLATLDQTLFLKNGGVVRNWLAARPGSLVDRLAKLPDANAIADELFLGVLTRYPTSDERTAVADVLHGGKTPALLAEMAWALLASAEFRFNH
jgi:Protein of unknown function (DUF1549)/Protein of unknown function (DUF1553)